MFFVLVARVVLRHSRRLTHLLQRFSMDGGGSTLRLRLSNDPPYERFRTTEDELQPFELQAPSHDVLNRSPTDLIELPPYAFRGDLAGVHAIGNADTAERVSGQGETGQRFEHPLDSGHAIQMTHRILGHG